MSDQQEGTPPAAAPEPAPVVDPTKKSDWVPRERLTEVIAERNMWRERASAAPDPEAVQRQLAELQAAVEAERNGRNEDRALFGAGITDADGQEVARLLYGKLSEKPEGGIGEWLTSLRAEGAEVPKALSPWLQPPAQPATTTTRPPTQAPRAAPPTEGRPDAGAIRAAREAFRKGELSAEQLRAMLSRA
jgi:hypothetical protein